MSAGTRIDEVDERLDLVLERRFAAPPDAVWRCLTENDLLPHWFAPRPVAVVEARVDPRPGGIFLVRMRMPDGTVMDGPPGCVLVAERPGRFVWTDALGPAFRPGPEPFFAAIVRIDPDGDGARYRVVARHADRAARDRHAGMGFEQGWGAAADRLGALARTL